MILKKIKRILAFTLLLAMLLSILPPTALAADLPTDGQYVIAANVNGVYYAMSNTFASKIDSTVITVTDGKVATADAAPYAVTLTKNGSNYSILLADGKYLAYGTSGTDFKSSNTPYNWTISDGENGTYRISATTGSGRGLVFRAKTYNQFGGYATSNCKNLKTEYYDIEILAIDDDAGSEIPPCDHASASSEITTSATCTEDGVRTYTCECGETWTETIEATGHSYTDGICEICGAEEPEAPAVVSYKLITLDDVKEGNYIIGAVRSGAYPTIYPATAKVSNYWYVSEDSVTVQDGIITADILPEDVQIVVLKGDNTNGFSVGFEVDGNMQYLGYTSTASNKLALSADYESTLWKIETLKDGFALINPSYKVFQNSTAVGAIRGYSSNQSNAKGLYLFAEVAKNSPEEPSEPTECTHKSKTVVAEEAPTCISDGYSDWTCNTCGESGRENLYASSEHHIPGEPSEAILLYPTCYYEGKKEIIIRCTTCNGVISHIADTPIPMLPHNYADGCCTVCQKDAPGKQFYLTDLANLPNAEYVVIYHPASGMAISLNASGEKLAGSAVTVENGVLTTAEDTAVFTFAYLGWETPKVFQVRDYDGRFLTSGETGNKLFYGEYEDYSSTDNVGLTYWIPTLVNEADSTVQIMNKAAAYNGNTNQALEFYNKDNLFTVYSAQNNDQFYFQFYTNIQPECVHEWDEGQVTTEPTCSTQGEKLLTCTLCGETKTEAIPTTNHSYVAGTPVPPTCTEEGYTLYTCSNCGDSYKGDASPATGHSFTEATCATPSICEICGILSGGYYAVSSQEDLNGEEKIVIVANVDGSYKALGTDIAATISAVDVTVANGQVSAANLPVWTLKPEEDGGFSLWTRDTGLKHSGSTSFGSTSADAPFSWIFKKTGNGIKIYSGNRGIIYRTDTTNAFKAYATSNIGKDTYYGELLIFKYIEGITIPHEDANKDNRCDNCGDPIDWNAILHSRSITLNGNIGVNFYMTLSEYVLTDEDAYMLFTQEGKEPVKVYLYDSNTRSVRGGKLDLTCFTYEVAAKEMTDTITAQFFYHDISTVKYTYSVRTYAENTTANLSDEDALTDLLKAMLHYGAASQIQFNYHTERLANDGLEPVDYTDVQIEGFPIVLPQGTDLVSFAGASLLLESETTLRFFLRADASAESFTVTYEGQPLKIKTRNGLYYVDVENISAPNLDMSFTITVNDGTNTADITYSPLTYCSSIRENHNTEQNQTLLDVCAALYLYNQAANTYFAPAE